MKPYISNIDGWIGGRRVKKGDVLLMSDAAAQYEPVREQPLSPDAAPEPTEAPVKAPLKRRSKA